MKHLLTGVAIAAALALAAPAWAQAPAPAGAPKPAAEAAPPAAPMAAKQRHKRVVSRHHRVAMRHHGRMAPGNSMTEQLNREELARIQGGGGAPAMPMAPPPNAGPGQGGPRASGH